YHMVDGSLFQYTDSDKLQALRYDFNPNNIRPSKENEHRRAVVEILRTMKYPKLSRVDIAFDFKGVDLSDYNFIDEGVRKKNMWFDGTNKLETLYIGAPNAHLRIRVYDKAKERATEGEQVEGDWWRVEAQIRGEWINHLLLGISPFSGLQIKQANWESLENVREQAMCKFFLDFPEKMAEVDKNTRSKYKKILASLDANKEIDIQSLYAESKTEIRKQIDYWLDFSRRNDVM
ncbi:replication initiation factor domain-containing protein, partial [Streptomyces sp. NPDC127197]